MAKQAITLKIAGKSYPFTIESGKEEMYRLAEREVNNYLALIKQQNIRNWTDMDYLSMTALKFAIAEIGMRQSRELGSEDLRRLEALDSKSEPVSTIPSSERPNTSPRGAGRKRDRPSGRKMEEGKRRDRKTIRCGFQAPRTGEKTEPENGRRSWTYKDQSTRIDSLQLCETEHFLNWSNLRRFKIRP